MSKPDVYIRGMVFKAMKLHGIPKGTEERSNPRIELWGGGDGEQVGELQAEQRHLGPEGRDAGGPGRGGQGGGGRRRWLRCLGGWLRGISKRIAQSMNRTEDEGGQISRCQKRVQNTEEETSRIVG